ncbi:MAG: hypothetical protein OCD00_03050 [Colwellia sp.]
MAINEQNFRSAQMTSICCATGGGKGIAVTSLGLIPLKSCVVVFDPYGEYKTRFGNRACHQYKSKRGFARAFRDAWQSNKPFVLSYFPQGDRLHEMEWFGGLVWAAANGGRVLYPVFEEYGKCVESISKDETIVGEIYSGGRKFGLRGIAIFQRSAEVPKTIWGNSQIKVIGAQEYTADAKRIVDQLGCPIDEVAELSTLNEAFTMYAPKLDDHVRTKTHYLMAKGFRNYKKVAAMVEPARHLTKNWSTKQRALNASTDYALINP